MQSASSNWPLYDNWTELAVEIHLQFIFKKKKNTFFRSVRNVKNTSTTALQEERKLGPFASAQTKSSSTMPIQAAAILTGSGLIGGRSKEDVNNSEVTYRPRKSKGEEEDKKPTKLTPRSSVSSHLSNCDSTESVKSNTPLEQVAT